MHPDTVVVVMSAPKSQLPAWIAPAGQVVLGAAVAIVSGAITSWIAHRREDHVARAPLITRLVATLQHIRSALDRIVESPAQGLARDRVIGLTQHITDLESDQGLLRVLGNGTVERSIRRFTLQLSTFKEDALGYNFSTPLVFGSPSDEEQRRINEVAAKRGQLAGEAATLRSEATRLFDETIVLGDYARPWPRSSDG